MRTIEFIILMFVINVLPFIVMICVILLMLKIWRGKI
jgi:hypothetical protein